MWLKGRLQVAFRRVSDGVQGCFRVGLKWLYDRSKEAQPPRMYHGFNLKGLR